MLVTKGTKGTQGIQKGMHQLYSGILRAAKNLSWLKCTITVKKPGLIMVMIADPSLRSGAKPVVNESAFRTAKKSIPLTSAIPTTMRRDCSGALLLVKPRLCIAKKTARTTDPGWLEKTGKSQQPTAKSQQLKAHHQHHPLPYQGLVEKTLDSFTNILRFSFN